MYWHSGHLGHVTSIMSSDFHFLVPESLHKKWFRSAKYEGYQNVCALILQLFNGIRYHTKHLSCVKPIYVQLEGKILASCVKI